MSEQAPPTESPADQGQSAQLPPLLLIAGSVAALLAALVVVVSFVLLLLVVRDVGDLQDQLARLVRSNKALVEELAQLKEAVAKPPGSATRASPSAPAPPRPTHIDAGDAAQDCVIRPGSKNPLADCLK